jgi:hypothetical protein
MKKFLIGYSGTMGTYGFYRGYNYLYQHVEFNKTQDKSLNNRMICGIGGTLYQLNPFLQPFFIYGIYHRCKKIFKNQELKAMDYEF